MIKRFYKDAHRMMIVNWDKKAAEWVNANDHEGLKKIHLFMYEDIMTDGAIKSLKVISDNCAERGIVFIIHASTSNMWCIARILRKENNLNIKIAKKTLEEHPLSFSIDTERTISYTANGLRFYEYDILCGVTSL